MTDGENRFFQAFEVSGIGMTITGLDGQFREVNPAFCEIVGYSREELLQMSVKDVTHPGDVPEIDEQRSRLGSANLNVQVVEKRYVTKSGETIWGSLTRSAIRDEEGNPLYIIGQLRDITKRKQLDALKDEFISIVSHELRTPLTSIHGALSLITGSALSDDPERLTELITIAKRNSDRLLALVNDILDFERLQTGQMGFEFDEVDLNEIATSGVDENQPYAAEFGSNIKLQTGTQTALVQGDPDRLGQVLTNLLSNAAKFSERDADIQVEVARNNSRWQVSVIDQGPGIDERDRDKIFEPFTQIDSTDTRQVEGTGLGLSICKRIMDAHGGKLDFEPASTGGTRFYFTLPATDQ